MTFPLDLEIFAPLLSKNTSYRACAGGSYSRISLQTLSLQITDSKISFPKASKSICSKSHLAANYTFHVNFPSPLDISAQPL